MKSVINYIARVFCLLLPTMVHAQSAGKVECPHEGDYVYLYSSMTTLDVRSTLQCGEQVQITGRYDDYYGVRTEKGETGYVPQNSLLVLKDMPGPRAPQPQPQRPARPRTAYDKPTAQVETPPSARPSGSGLTLLNGTPIHLKLSRAVSSANAHVGDQVDLEVLEEVVVDGLSVIVKGATAFGVVTDAEPKKRLGHGGKLGFTINSVRLSDNEKVAVRAYQEAKGSNTTAGAVLPMVSGKDVAFAPGTEFTAYVDGDMHLKREAFQVANDDARPAPRPSTQNLSQLRGS